MERKADTTWNANTPILGNSLPVRSGMDRPTVQIMLGDDQRAVRGMLRQLLEVGDCEIVGECEQSEEMVAICEAHRVDLLIIDVAMQHLAFCEFLKNLKACSPETRVLVFSRWSHPLLVRNCIVAGVHGIVFKNDSVEMLRQAIGIISQGGMYFSPAVESFRVDRTHQLLTDREQMALCLIAQGYSTKELAEVMTISCKTAEKYRERVMSKLGLHDAVRLTHFAIQAGLVAP